MSSKSIELQASIETNNQIKQLITPDIKSQLDEFMNASSPTQKQTQNSVQILYGKVHTAIFRLNQR